LQILWQEINETVTQIKVTIGCSTRNLESDIPQQTAQIIQLPVWPESKRGVPNSAFRGSLFAAIQGKQRQAFKKTLICDEDNLKIYFTGWQFDQSDLDVWEALLHIAKDKPLGTPLEFTENSLLKMLGRSNGKANYEWLRETIDRLNSGLIQITHNNYSYMGNLLTEAERDEITNHAKIIINPKMKRLFDAGYTITNWDERQRIGTRKPLALWLHGFIGSHAKLYPTKVETFHRLSGSVNAEMHGFKRQLIKALDYLKGLDLIKDFWLENNLVHIEKYPSKSQMKHLAKKKK
ncbi:MAG: hypothetical protein ACJARD_001442, partial [Alphaproteobacteria bacterium]